ncbi:MAG: hypothetical protein HC807_07295 [Gammaproteobacteria bacterium]|nr:hypothetical protein [Gammaproteobacteria bacterium]
MGNVAAAVSDPDQHPDAGSTGSTGGPGVVVLHWSPASAGLIDELIIYMAPRLLGSSARGMFELPALDGVA